MLWRNKDRLTTIINDFCHRDYAGTFECATVLRARENALAKLYSMKHCWIRGGMLPCHSCTWTYSLLHWRRSFAFNWTVFPDAHPPLVSPRINLTRGLLTRDILRMIGNMKLEVCLHTIQTITTNMSHAYIPLIINIVYYTIIIISYNAWHAYIHFRDHSCNNKYT